MKKAETEEKKDQKDSKNEKPARSRKTKPILYASGGGFCLLVVVLYLVPANYYVGGYGNVLSARDAVLRAGSKGPIRAVLAHSGDRVQKDQIIIELEDDVERADLERCQRELNQARDELTLLRETFAVEREKDRFQLDSAKVKLKDSEAEYLRVKSLRASQATSDLELRMALTKQETDRAEFQEKSINKEKLRDAQIRVLERRIDILTAQVTSAERVLARRKIFAPMGGVLVMHTLALGQVVDANEVLGQVFDDQYYQMIAHIPEQFAPDLQPGQPVRMELTAYPPRLFDYFWGTVTSVSPVVNPNASGDGSILVRAKIDQLLKGSQLKAGMSVKLSIEAGKISLLCRIIGIRSHVQSKSTTTQPAR